MENSNPRELTIVMPNTTPLSVKVDNRCPDQWIHDSNMYGKSAKKSNISCLDNQSRPRSDYQSLPCQAFCEFENRKRKVFEVLAHLP